MALQPPVMVCPDARVNLSDQPLMAVLPVFLIVMLSVRPVFHGLSALVTWQAPEPPGVLDALGRGDELVGVGPEPALTVMLELPLL